MSTLYYQWNHIDNMPILPESRHIKVQGKPGTGKKFVIKTMRNITKNMLNRNHLDEATSPTGVVASLIDGKTHFRSLRISVSSKKSTILPQTLL